MSFELALGIITIVALGVILSQLKKGNFFFTVLAVCGFVVFAGLCITLISAVAGVDSLMIDQANPPW